VLLAFGFFGLLRMRKAESFGINRPVFVFGAVAFLLLALFEIVFSHLQEGGLFDRHILIVAFPLLFCAGRVHRPALSRSAVPGAPAFRRLPLISAGIAIIAFAAFSVAATHDYMQWNRIRWQMGRQLLTQGVDPLSIVGGFEFNAWNNYDAFVARGRTAQVSHWWYDRRDYIITMMPMDGYEIRQKLSYNSWVHQRPVDIYLISDSRFQIPD